MRQIFIFLISFFWGISAMSQDAVGTWLGELKIGPQKLRVVFNVAKKDQGYTATMDSPDQGAYGIPVGSVRFENNTLDIQAPNLGMVYQGVVNKDEMEGTFKQGGASFPLVMKKQNGPIVRNRPQNPKAPFPYKIEELKFRNPVHNIDLAGTLTLPATKKPVPVVVLISGSGPQNRDEELAGHKPFWVLADYLSRNGIAVLRYDDRGVGASQGDFKSATTTDLAEDVKAAVSYLKTRTDIDPARIGLIGHSEGGIIAPMVAAQGKDIAFAVLMAGTSISGNQLLLLQSELISKASKVPTDVIARNLEQSKKLIDIILPESKDLNTLKSDLTQFKKELVATVPEASRANLEKGLDSQISQLLSPWMVNFLRYNPAPALEKVKCPVLAINGDRDLQVPSRINLDGIEAALKKGGNSNVTIVEFPGLNHLFQACQTGLPQEYGEIEQTISPAVLEKITTWIQAQVR